MFIKNSLKPYNKIHFYFSQKKAIYQKLNQYQQKFEEGLKQKYINPKFKDQKFQQFDPEHLKQSINSEYDELKEEISQNGGILREVRKALLGMDLDQDKQEQLEQEDFEEPQEHVLHEGLSHEEFLRRASVFQQQLFQKQIPDNFVKDQINSQYGNYSSYDKNYVKLKNMNEKIPELDQIHFGQLKVHQYLENNLLTQDGYSELWEQFQQELNLQKVKLSKEQALEEFYSFLQEQAKDFDEFIPEFEEMDNTNFNDPVELRGMDDARLSVKARDDIYELYQQGWSIKDISTRYGILPERVKAVIWCCEKFYLQILPKATPLQVYLTYKMEEEWAEENGGWQDYGIDLEELEERERGTRTINFEQYKEVDFGKPSKNWTREERELIKFRHTPKSEKVTLKLDGGQYQRGYLIKEWISHRGKCRKDVSKAFKTVLKYSHQPEKLPASAINKLEKGPRIAAQGLGSKL